MSKKHLQLNSHTIPASRRSPQTRGAWWYEEAGHIHIVTELRDDNGVSAGTTQVQIPWRSIRAALARLDKPDSK